MSMKKKLSYFTSIVLCVAMVASTVYAYPVGEDVYPLNSAKLSSEELTDVETEVLRTTNTSTDHAYSPAICILSKGEVGRILVSYDISGKKGGVRYSDDGGSTFKEASFQNNTQRKFLFGNVFETNTGVYLIARRHSSNENYNGQLIIYKSTDNGATWGDFSVIDEGVWHTAPSEVVYSDDGKYVYLTWEAQDTPAAQLAGGAGRAILAPVILKASVDADLTQKSNWTISDTTMSYYDVVGGTTWDKLDYMGLPLNRDRYVNETTGTNSYSYFGWLEGNIVRITDKDNELYDPDAFCHIYLRSSSGSADIANIMKVVDDGTGKLVSEPVTTPSGKTLLYVQVPGGQSKFSINYDKTSDLYWLVSNICTDSMAIDTTMGAGATVSRHEGPHDLRNVLGLYYSKNAMDWDFAGYVSRTDNIDQARSYASMEIYGDDLYVVSRSGDEKAESAHNTNLILLHKIENFRQYAETKISATDDKGTALANNNGALFYDSNVLKDDSVNDIQTYVTASGATVVSCSISDDKGTESKVLVKSSGDYYAQTLSTNYKLGKAFEANNALYVFGVADKKLVAFKSTNNGTTWSEPATIDTTCDWYEAPTSSLISDNKIMLALSQLEESKYQVLRGYSSADSSGSFELTSTGATLTGYGAVMHTEAFSVGVGESIEVTVSPKTMQDEYPNQFYVVFSDTLGSYWGNPADTGNGIAFRLKSNNNYYKNGQLGYNMVNQGALGSDGNLMCEAQKTYQFQGDMTANTFTVKLTRTEDASYPWVMTATTTANTYEYVYKIPAEELASNAFDKGVYVSAANSEPKTATMKYDITNPIVKCEMEESTEEPAWVKYATNNASYTGTVEANGEELKLSGYTAAHYTQRIPIQVGTKISYDVQFPTVVTGKTMQYPMGLTTHKDSYYVNASDTKASATVATHFVGTSGNGLQAQGEAKLSAATKYATAKQTVTAAADWANVQGKTYTVTFTKQANTSSVSWVITIGEKNAAVAATFNIPASNLAHTAFDATGAYIVAGAAIGTANQLKITNISIEQPNSTDWSVIRNYSGNSGSVTQNDENATVLTGNGAVAYKDNFKLFPGESVSVTFEPKSLVKGQNNKFFVMFGDTANSFFGATASDTGSGVAFELRSGGDYTLRGNALYGTVTNGVLGTQSGITNSSATSEVSGDMTKLTYTVTFTRTWSSANPWKMVLTTSANSAQWTKEISATDLPADAFDNGLYISAGCNGPVNKTIQYNVTDVTYNGNTATATAEDAYKVAPVVMTANLTEDLMAASSWTYSEGVSIVSKLGSVYANGKLDYFGLPYEKVDPRTIGWTDLKLFKLSPTDDIRYDAATGNVFGYMTFTEAGYNYAAFVKVNTSTNAIEFFTPASQKERVEEEEFVFAKLPGGNNGFELMFDSTSKLYWLVTTVNTDTVNRTDKSAAEIAVYYSANAYDWTYGGKVADVTSDAKVSAAFSGDNIVITAVDDGVVNYTVPQYARLAYEYNWKVTRGYGVSAGSPIEVDGSKLILNGKGAVHCTTNIENQENTEISFVVKATDLTNTGSQFSVGLMDTMGSFYGNADNDTGNGFVVSILPYSGHDGVRYVYSVVKAGQLQGTINSNTQIGAQIQNTEMLNNDITVKFIKRTQTTSKGACSWTVEISEANGRNIRTFDIPAADVAETLFDNGCYLVAGCTNQSVAYEIDNIQVRQPMKGDVNCDGEVNVMDVVASDYRFRNEGSKTYSAYEIALYDINDDGKVTYNDDIKELRKWILANTDVSRSKSAEGATTGNVRLERKHYEKDGEAYTDVTINTDFLCGGLEGVLSYDKEQLQFVGMECCVGTPNPRNVCKEDNTNDTWNNDEDKGRLMITALGWPKTGTKGDIVTLTFKGQIKEWNHFNIEYAVFVNADGTEQLNVELYDSMLGHVTGQEDFDINAKDLVRMKKMVGKTSSKNADCDRSSSTLDSIPDNNDCKYLRDYLCGKIPKF